jgi:hypothetical protein
MEHPYKSHAILITCWPTIEPFGCVPETRINNEHQFVVKTKLTQKIKNQSRSRKLMLSMLPKTDRRQQSQPLQKAK